MKTFGWNVANNLTESGKKATLGVDNITMSELRDALNEMNLSMKGSVTILWQSFKKELAEERRATRATATKTLTAIWTMMKKTIKWI